MGESAELDDLALKKGTAELLALAQLEGGPRHGYEIAQRIAARSEGAVSFQPASLYPVLYRLERAGFVEVRWETQPRGVPRKYYRLTEAGRRELAELTREWTTFAEAMNRLLGQKWTTS